MHKRILYFIIIQFCLFGCNTDNDDKENDNFLYHEIYAPFEMAPLKEYKFPTKDFFITDFGASASNDNTSAINYAINACCDEGGGRVIIPRGIWFTGPIHLKSNVNLHLEAGAILRFSDDPEKYLPAVKSSWEGMECLNYSPLIYAFECKNIAITGNGIIQPDMKNWTTWFERTDAHLLALKNLYNMMSTGAPVEERNMAVGENHLRPHLIQFNRCQNILLDGIIIRESPFWTIHMFLCDNGIVRNLDVKAHGNNNDGIDLEMSSNFLIEDCIFDQGDDAIVIKSGRNHDGWRLNKPSQNIVIRNCEVLKGNTLLGIGSELSAGIQNIYLHNCKTPQQVYRLLQIKTNHRRGGFVKNVFMDNIQVDKIRYQLLDIDTDVFYQWKDLVQTYDTVITSIDNITIRNIQCNEVSMIYDLKGDSRNPIGTVNLYNIHVDKVLDKIKNIENVMQVTEDNVTVGCIK